MLLLPLAHSMVSRKMISKTRLALEKVMKFNRIFSGLAIVTLIIEQISDSKNKIVEYWKGRVIIKAERRYNSKSL